MISAKELLKNYWRDATDDKQALKVAAKRLIEYIERVVISEAQIGKRESSFRWDDGYIQGYNKPNTFLTSREILEEVSKQITAKGYYVYYDFYTKNSFGVSEIYWTMEIKW